MPSPKPDSSLSPGLDDPRPHMLLGIIVRSKAVFKRPRAISQRSASPPRKRRTSTSSTGSGTESPLRDSPVAEIDDIVFQYHSGQAKKAASGRTASPGGTGTTPSGATPSETSSSSAHDSPAQSAQEQSSMASLQAQKQHLLELQERARHYILSQVQKKDTKQQDGHPEGALSGKTPEGSEPYDPELGAQPEAPAGGDAPYDPEEGLDLDLSPKSEESKLPSVSQSVSAATIIASLQSSLTVHSSSSAGAAVMADRQPGNRTPEKTRERQDPQDTRVAQSLLSSFPLTGAVTRAKRPVVTKPIAASLQSHPLLSTSGSQRMESSRMDTGSAPGSQMSEPGLTSKRKESSRENTERASFDRPRSLSDGLSQQDRMSAADARPQPTPDGSRFVMPEPPEIARAVSSFSQRPSEGLHSNTPASTHSYDNRAQIDRREDRGPPAQAPRDPHQRAPYDNAPQPGTNADEELRYHRDEQRSPERPGERGWHERYSRDARARDPSHHDNRWHDRRNPYDPPRRWSDEDRHRDRERGREREPHSRFGGPYDNRGRYDEYRRDHRAHDEYRRDRWRR